MIPRLGDGNLNAALWTLKTVLSLENDSPSRGRKLPLTQLEAVELRLENDSPSRGRKRNRVNDNDCRNIQV